jgi:hypothetical protein
MIAIPSSLRLARLFTRGAFIVSGTQQKLYAQTKWRVVGDTFTVSATDFAVGQSYKVSVSGNRISWVGTEDQGTVVFQR